MSESERNTEPVYWKWKGLGFSSCAAPFSMPSARFQKETRRRMEVQEEEYRAELSMSQMHYKPMETRVLRKGCASEIVGVRRSRKKGLKVMHITVARGHGGGSNTACEVLFDHKLKFNFTREGRGILFRFMYNAQKQRQKQGVWARSIYSGSNFEDDRSKIELGESLWFQGMKWACTRGFSKKWHETQVPFPDADQLLVLGPPVNCFVLGQPYN
ncbi:hypothetical protein DFH08DRAFT_805182 [Mycena albidolilacea]|uniref:Uncharacterized protein n=1 Tax=Mycena albidolilacea TaxID=1033008 RepID=A0AAD7AB07_9AGAR|nr:hypothetical protein DFH08DRAFT_805182 [Mycena albidolilacea]